VIVSAREFNKEEKEFTAASKLEFDDYYIALGAVAVVLNKSNPLKELRMSEVDSIFSGSRTRWRPRAGGEGNIVDVAVGGINSSVNEVVRRTVLTGKPFALTATSFSSSEKLVGYVLTKPGAVGITGVAWLKGHDRDLTVCALGTPGARPDSTQPPGKFYPPVQAHVYRKYYPITTPVHMYNRKVTPDVGYGFISYVTSPRGQQIILENGLVPVTMPVRLVELTQRQVQ
jgi:phosphate transport system substrate-binding protein